MCGFPCRAPSVHAVCPHLLPSFLTHSLPFLSQKRRVQAVHSSVHTQLQEYKGDTLTFMYPFLYAACICGVCTGLTLSCCVFPIAVCCVVYSYVWAVYAVCVCEGWGGSHTAHGCRAVYGGCTCKGCGKLLLSLQLSSPRLLGLVVPSHFPQPLTSAASTPLNQLQQGFQPYWHSRG